MHCKQAAPSLVSSDGGKQPKIPHYFQYTSSPPINENKFNESNHFQYFNILKTSTRKSGQRMQKKSVDEGGQVVAHKRRRVYKWRPSD